MTKIQKLIFYTNSSIIVSSCSYSESEKTTRIKKNINREFDGIFQVAEIFLMVKKLENIEVDILDSL